METKTTSFRTTAVLVFLLALAFIVIASAITFNLSNFQAQVPPPSPPMPISNCQIEAEVLDIKASSASNYLVSLKITKLLSSNCLSFLQGNQTLEATLSSTEFLKSPGLRKGAVIRGFISFSSGKYILTNVSTVTPPIPPATPQNYNIPLKKGWNMISIPVNSKTARERYYQPRAPLYSYSYIPILPNQFTVNDIKGCSIKEIWEYQPSTGRFIKPTYLNAMKGYFVLVDNDCTGSIYGYRYNQSLPLYKGWNMISSKYSWNEINISSPFSNQKSCIETSKIFYFNTEKNQYEEVSETTKLDDTRSYWIAVDKNCTINEFNFEFVVQPPTPPTLPPSVPQPLPVVDIKANNSDGPITITYNTAATISWTSSNVTSCTITPGNWTGTSGSQSSGNLTQSTVFTATCVSTNGNISDSVTVNVSQIPASSGPTISSLNPVSGGINEKVVITGTNFTASGNTVKFGAGFIHNLNSTNNGTKIEFFVPGNLNTCATLDFSLADSLPQCQTGSPAVTPGTYPVSVSNANGSSNSVNFTVTENLGAALPFETLLKGATSISPDRANYVIREPPEYENMWFKHFGRIARPFVDLGNQNMLLAVFAGNKTTGGYGIEIKSIYYDRQNFKLNVIVKEYIPDTSCNVAQVENQPYHIVKLNKNYAEVNFKMETEKIVCR